MVWDARCDSFGMTVARRRKRMSDQQRKAREKAAYMSTPDLQQIMAELNSRARAHPIGMLQELRARLRGLSRKAGHDIFSLQTTKDDYAFHHGGRSELQFNIGEIGAPRGFRFGVAFSFEPSRT